MAYRRRPYLAGSAALVTAAALLGACTEANPGFNARRDSTSSGADVTIDAGVILDDARRDGPEVTDAVPPLADTTVDQPPPPAKPVGVDVLVVVDNSPGMEGEQARLANDIKNLLEQLDKLPGGPSYRIGVVTTDMGIGQPNITSSCGLAGDAGHLFIRSQCVSRPQGVNYIEVRGNNDNVQGSRTDALDCMLRPGASGCGFEQPLEAMYAALSGANPGFLRPDAALAVIILANEDDCSAADKSLYLPSSTQFGPYRSFRCFEFGVICDGSKPARAAAKYQSCVPGQSTLHPIKARYVDFLSKLKPAGWVSVLVLAGPNGPQPIQVNAEGGSGNTQSYDVAASCQSGTLSGTPAIRLQSFSDAFGPLGDFASICQSYGNVLRTFATRIQSAF
ncbi:MAG: hypothetical protein KC503_29515 [Myxococcales bacterium]|nr:hypothetical protein [Myxococcales bacterium]